MDSCPWQFLVSLSVSLWETKILGQDAIFGDFVLNSCNRKEEERRSMKHLQNEISSFIKVAPLCYLQNLGLFSSHFSSYFPHIYALFWRIYNFFCRIYRLFGEFTQSFVTTNVYALPLKFLKSLLADFFPHLVWAKFWVPLLCWSLVPDIPKSVNLSTQELGIPGNFGHTLCWGPQLYSWEFNHQSRTQTNQVTNLIPTIPNFLGVPLKGIGMCFNQLNCHST